MKYQLVYKEHDDKFGNWLVCNERGEYAAAPTGVAGAKPRRWLLSEDAVKYMQQRASVDVSFVWLSEPTVCQGKPGATSMRHTDMHHSTAAAYKPSHGGYSGTHTGRMVSSTPSFAELPKRNEIPPSGTVHTGGNEEAGTIPDAVVFMAIVDAGIPTSLLRGLLAARSTFPKL